MSTDKPYWIMDMLDELEDRLKDSPDHYTRDEPTFDQLLKGDDTDGDAYQLHS